MFRALHAERNHRAAEPITTHWRQRWHRGYNSSYNMYKMRRRSAHSRLYAPHTHTHTHAAWNRRALLGTSLMYTEWNDTFVKSVFIVLYACRRWASGGAWWTVDHTGRPLHAALGDTLVQELLFDSVHVEVGRRRAQRRGRRASYRARPHVRPARAPRAPGARAPRPRRAGAVTCL